MNWNSSSVTRGNGSPRSSIAPETTSSPRTRNWNSIDVHENISCHERLESLVDQLGVQKTPPNQEVLNHSVAPWPKTSTHFQTAIKLFSQSSNGQPIWKTFRATKRDIAEDTSAIAQTWRRHLRDLASHDATMEAAGEIAIVREAFESVVTSAEASLRIMRPRLKPIHPSATDKVRTLLKQHTDNLPQSLMESAILLIATTLEAINTIPLPEVELGNEALEVIWGDSAELQWIIRTPPFSWPGVHVKALSSNSPQNVRSFVLAHHVIDHAKSILR